MKKSFFQKMTFFFKKMSFFHFFMWVYGYLRDPLAIALAWVPNMGVYNQFLGASGLIEKKNGQILQFSNLVFFAVTRPKVVESAQNQNHPTRLSKIYLHSKFQLIWPSNGRKIQKKQLLGGHCHFCGCS